MKLQKISSSMSSTFRFSVFINLHPPTSLNPCIEKLAYQVPTYVPKRVPHEQCRDGTDERGGLDGREVQAHGEELLQDADDEGGLDRAAAVQDEVG